MSVPAQSKHILLVYFPNRNDIVDPNRAPIIINSNVFRGTRHLDQKLNLLIRKILLSNGKKIEKKKKKIRVIENDKCECNYKNPLFENDSYQSERGK